MLNSKDPDLLELRSYLNKLGDKRRAPQWTISWNETWFTDKVGTTAAQHLEPGHYKIDRDFVIDSTAEVRKGKLSASFSTPTFRFADESRVHKTTGVMKGIVGHRDRDLDTSPGQYPLPDGVATFKRVQLPSSTAWSMPRGEAQEEVRERRLQGRAPPPGSYTLPSFFDDVDRQRQETHSSGSGRHRPRTQWKNQWQTMFRAIHASQAPKARAAAF
mmetsp:Transcript_71417/g.167302  ORF Transcript_71417/g.167302 Transcript_71417/m.167302 type:complete len:216 (-) Transcript_71417:49-696(-)